MSRIGLSPISIPQGVEVNKISHMINFKGKLGELSVDIIENISVNIKEGNIIVSPDNMKKQTRQSWGTLRSLLNNAVVGVTEGYKKELELNGVGYRASISGNILKLSLGFSHDVEHNIPEGLKASVKGNVVTIEGISKQKVGQCAAEIKAYRKPEPYKGKGIKYVGEVINRKESKKK